MHHFLTFVFLTMLPSAYARAFTATTPTDLKGLVGSIVGIVNILIPLIFALIFLTIAWGVIKAWIMSDASEDDVETGKKIALVGIIVLVVLSAFWGILTLIKNGLFGG